MSSKCFKCKKPIKPLSQSVISFYATLSETDDQEYNFCSEDCLDGFFRDRMEFRAIVRRIEKDGK